MGLGLLWAYVKNAQNGFIISNDSMIYRIRKCNAVQWAIDSVGGTKEGINSLQEALGLIFQGGENKIAFRLAGNTLKPNPVIGVNDSDIPVLDDTNNNLKCYCWGKRDDDYCILTANLTSCRVTAEFLKKVDVLENRRGKYMNIVGVDNEILMKSKQTRNLNGLHPYLNPADIHNRIPVVNERGTDIAVTKIQPIEAYSSKFLQKYTSANMYITPNGAFDKDAMRRGMLLYYGQFKRYKSAVAMMDYLLSPCSQSSGIDNVSFDDFIPSFLDLTKITKHEANCHSIAPVLKVLRKSNFPAYLERHIQNTTVLNNDKALLSEMHKCISTNRMSIGLDKCTKLYETTGMGDFRCTTRAYEGRCVRERDAVLSKLIPLFDESGIGYVKYIKTIAKTVNSDILAYSNGQGLTQVINVLNRWCDFSVYDKIDFLFAIDFGSRKKFERDRLYNEVFSNASGKATTLASSLSTYTKIALRKIFNCCAVPVTGVSARDGFTERIYNLHGVFYILHKFNLNKTSIDMTGVMDFLTCISSNPYLAVAGLINDKVIEYTRDLLKAMDTMWSSTFTRYGSNVYFFTSHNKTIDVTYGVLSASTVSDWLFLSPADARVPEDKNIVEIHKRCYESTLSKMVAFTDELVKNYCLAIIYQVLRQDMGHVKHNQLLETYENLCSTVGLVNLLSTCIYLRYKYFNPVVTVDIADTKREHKRGIYEFEILRNWQPYTFNRQPEQICVIKRETDTRGNIVFKGKVKPALKYQNRFTSETPVKNLNKLAKLFVLRAAQG